ncbi:MAG: hypothetical protein GYB31_19780 [Bacteroidetes bacterium]|nr:hypothetical protein [Bacteroidota bacterium]
MNNVNYNRLLVLKRKIDGKQATSEEKKEYLYLLYMNGNITKGQYDEYIKNQKNEDILNAGLTIGGVLLATWLLSELLKK